MARMVNGGIEALRAAVRGVVHCPRDPGYDEVRKVWNSQIDRRPAAVVMCEGPSDVSAAIAHAAALGHRGLP